MTDVIFCRTRHEYSSYVDFWRLVELSDYPIIYVDELDPQSDNTYIITPLNGEWNGGWLNPRAHIILWDLEWHLGSNPGDVTGITDVWAADEWYAQEIGAKYVPLGSHKELKLPALFDNQRPDGVTYDAATLWYVTPRRHDALTQMQQQGVSIAPPTNLWGANRHKVLSQSRVMVHVHQRDDAFTVAPQRFALAAAYGLSMITETLACSGIFTPAHRLMSDLRHIGEYTAVWLRPENRERLADYGAALHELLCEQWTFRKAVEAAL